MIHERTQGESHPRQTINTQGDQDTMCAHRYEGRMTRRHPFVDWIMEVDLPVGWKPLNLERYDGTIDPDEHLDTFLTQANLYTNDGTIMYWVFPTSLKGVALTWCRGLPSKSVDRFETLVQHFSSQYATSRSHCLTFAALVSLRQADDESLRKFMDRSTKLLSKLKTSILKWHYTPCSSPCNLVSSRTACVKSLPITWTSCTNEPKEEMFRFRNEVWQGGHKHDKMEGGTKTDSHKSDKRYKSDKR